MSNGNRSNRHLGRGNDSRSENSGILCRMWDFAHNIINAGKEI